ncbi:diguanylate cyclase (GGDEF)-like protein/PAS domain S-box-containing protein [Massilia sp. MP_M2]|uniref:sensor domain-containing diguanylate cyclase n=1 Tax=Massilia sp. MP_M2 TaxID=3071713 RepID=UPI00319DE326
MSDALAQLSTEYEALIQFLYLAPVGLVQLDADGEIAMINPIAAQLLMPHSRNGGLDNLFVALEDIAPDLRNLCQQSTIQSGKICDGMHVHLHAGSGSGKRMPQILSITLLRLDASRIMAVIDDITEQVRRECRQRQNDAWLNAVLTGIADYALASLDAQGRLCEWNPSIGRVTGFGQDAEGQSYTMFYPADAITPEHALDRLREADADGWALDESRLLRADGSAFWGSVMIAPLPEADRETADGTPCLPCEAGAAYCLILRDVSDKRDIAERRRREAFSDYLTGLANRRALFDATSQELERSRAAPRPTAMIILDADHFKAVNDRYGHPGGDAVLQHLAAILLDFFREVDVVARIGGEEFAVLLPSTDLARALELAERLCARVALDAKSFDGQAIVCTISAGVAVAVDGHGGVDLLIKQADQALYAAKRAGRNRALTWQPEAIPAATQEALDGA